MTDNVHVLSVNTTLDIPVERVLDAFPRDAECCVVIGKTVDGELYLASSLGRIQDTNWMIDKAKEALLSHG